VIGFDRANIARDKELRHRLLTTLYFCRNSPTGGYGGLPLFSAVGGEGAGDFDFDGADHFLCLMRDLINKGLVTETLHTRRQGEPFGPRFVSYRITAKGTSLKLETIPPDPDIADSRITVEGED